MPATGKKYIHGIILIAILLCLTAPAQAEMVIRSGDSTPAGTAAAWNDLGNSFASQKRWDMALDAYNKAIALEPGFARAYFNKGKVLAALGRHEDAITAYEKAVALEPSLAPVVKNYLDISLAVVYPPIPSGALIKGSFQPGWQYLEIDNTAGTSDVVVALAPRGIKGATNAVYVKKGFSHRFDQIVPQGPYDVYITFGERWDPRIKEFAIVGGYLKWELPQYFSGPETRGYTMTFINWQPYPSWWSYTLTPITAEQFPAL